VIAATTPARYPIPVTFEPTRLYAPLVERLSEVPGVFTAAVFEESGQCLACYVGRGFTDFGVGRAIPILQELAAPEERTLPFEEGVTFVEKRLVRVLLRRAGASTFIMLVEPEADVDVLAAYLARAADQVARATRARSSAPPASKESMIPNVGTSGFYARPDTTSDASAVDRPSHGPVSPRTVDPETVQRLETLTLGSLGVAADVVFSRMKASVTNAAGQIPRGRWLELVGRLASEIDDDAAREEFVAQAMALPTRGRESEALELLSPLAKFVVGRRTG